MIQRMHPGLLMVVIALLCQSAFSQDSYFLIKEDVDHKGKEKDKNMRRLGDSRDKEKTETVIGSESSVVIYGMVNNNDNQILLNTLISEIKFYVSDKNGNIIVNETKLTPANKVKQSIEFWSTAYIGDHKKAELEDGHFILTITKTDNKVVTYNFALKRYKMLLLLIDWSNKQQFSSNFLEGIAATARKSQLNLSYFRRKNQGDLPLAVFHVPILRFESRSIILNNLLELGLAIPVDVNSLVGKDEMNSKIDLKGWGLSFGFLRTSSDKTVFQVGSGFESKFPVPKKPFFLMGIDGFSLIQFLVELPDNVISYYERL